MSDKFAQEFVKGFIWAQEQAGVMRKDAVNNIRVFAKEILELTEKESEGNDNAS